MKTYFNNDVGLLKLDTKIKFSNLVSIIKLPTNSKDSYEGVKATVSGWGQTKDDDLNISQNLNFVTLSVVDNKECQNIYGSNVVKDSNICVSTSQEKSACMGDSGGPLVYNGTLIGVFSYFSAEGCQLDQPVGFTRIASYLDWIKKETKIWNCFIILFLLKN